MYNDSSHNFYYLYKNNVLYVTVNHVKFNAILFSTNKIRLRGITIHIKEFINDCKFIGCKMENVYDMSISDCVIYTTIISGYSNLSIDSGTISNSNIIHGTNLYMTLGNIEDSSIQYISNLGNNTIHETEITNCVIVGNDTSSNIFITDSHITKTILRNFKLWGEITELNDVTMLNGDVKNKTIRYSNIMGDMVFENVTLISCEYVNDNISVDVSNTLSRVDGIVMNKTSPFCVNGIIDLYKFTKKVLSND